MKKQNNKTEIKKVIEVEDIFLGASLKEVYKGMSKEEKKLYKSITNKRSHTSHMRTKVMANVMLYKQGKLDEEKLLQMKKISFEDAEANIIWHAMNYKAENETSLSVMDLYASGYMALEKAWGNFLEKSEEEKKKNIKDGKPVFASFKTFSESYIRTNIVLEIMKQKAIDEHTFDVPKTARYHAKTVSQTIQSIICMTGKMPTVSEIASSLNISKKTVENSLNLLGIGETGKLSETEIKEKKEEITRDFDFSTAICEDLNPMEKTVMEESKTTFWSQAKKLLGDRAYNCLSSYFVDGRTYQSIGDELGLTRERVRQIINESMEKIKTNPDLLQILLDSVKRD